MADQSEIVQELYNRVATLPPDKAAIVTELARRLGVQSAPTVSDVAAGARASALGRMTAHMDTISPAPDTTPAPGLVESFENGLGSLNPKRILSNWADRMNNPAERDSYADGSIADLAPVGPAIQAVDQASNGNIGGAIGTAAAAAVPLAIPFAVKGAATVGANVAARVAPKINFSLPRSGTPVQQAATDWALQNGAPLDAAAATHNPLIRGTQEIARSTIGAGAAADRAIETRNQWYADKGRDLAAQAYPEPQTPETAGRAINADAVRTIQQRDAAATDSYSALRDREKDPDTWDDVQTGTQPETRQMQVGTKQVAVPGLVNPDGSPAFREEPVFQNVTRDVPVTERIPMPVDMRDYKAQFAPMLAELQRATRLGQSQYAPAQIALEDLVNGPDFKPASAAEKDLSALKQVSRNNTLTGGVKNDAGGLAAGLIPQLQDAIDSTVRHYGGADALNDLQMGRLNTAGKYGAIELADQFRSEPVKLFQQLTATKDGAIDLLNKVNDLAPDQMPKLGRAYLDAILDHATQEGGFGHAAKAFADWNRLGDSTKQILYKNPALISDLDNFFQSAKDSTKIENTSGTARVAHLSGQGQALALSIFHPLVALGTAGYIISANALSRLLYNPAFVRASIRAMKTPAGSAGAAAAASQLVKAAGTAASRVTPGTAGAMAPGASPVQASKGGVLSNGATSTQPSGTTPGITAAPGGTQGTSGGGLRSADTVVSVPGKPLAGYTAKYAVRELNDVQPSHSGQTFLANPKYGVENDRDYQNAVNQGKIVAWSSPVEFNPKQLVNDVDDATSGPPVVDQAGNVLGGNGRTMIMQRVYNGNPKGAAAYRALLQQKAPQFGIDPAELANMKRPVLVREIPEAEFSKPGQSKQDAVTDFNVKGTASLTPEEQAISDSRRVSPETLEDVATRLDSKGADATLAQVLDGQSGVEVLSRLIDDGVVSPQERAAFAKDDKLTDAGKDRISQLLLARFFKDPKQLETIAPSVRNKVERLAAPLVQVENRGEWNLSPDVGEALDLLHKAQALKIKGVDDFVKQDGLFGGQKYSTRAIELAKMLKDVNGLDLAAAARQYAQDANFASGGDSLFGAAPTPESSFEDAFGGALKAAEKKAAEQKAAKRAPANSLANVGRDKAAEKAALDRRRKDQRGSWSNKPIEEEGRPKIPALPPGTTDDEAPLFRVQVPNTWGRMNTELHDTWDDALDHADNEAAYHDGVRIERSLRDLNTRESYWHDVTPADWLYPATQSENSGAAPAANALADPAPKSGKGKKNSLSPDK